MPSRPRIPGAAIFQATLPMQLIGVGWMDNDEMGFPEEISDTARVDSNPLLVAGFNAFTFFCEPQAGPNLEVFVSHCDPTTGVVLTTELLDTVTFGGGQVIEFGAFANLLPSTNASEVWYVIRLGLLSDGPGVGFLDDSDLLMGVR